MAKARSAPIFPAWLAARNKVSVTSTGAAGNIGAGKYNDGAPEKRRVLAYRLADAMGRARAA